MVNRNLDLDLVSPSKKNKGENVFLYLTVLSRKLRFIKEERDSLIRRTAYDILVRTSYYILFYIYYCFRVEHLTTTSAKPYKAIRSKRDTDVGDFFSKTAVGRYI